MCYNNSLGEESGIKVRKAVDGEPSDVPVVPLTKKNKQKTKDREHDGSDSNKRRRERRYDEHEFKYYKK